MPPAPTTSAQALGNFQQFAGSMQSPDQAYAGAEQSLGVPQAQQQVSGLRQAVTNTTNLLNNVAPSVMGRTANSLVTSAQANRQIGNEEAPIAANLKDQSTKEAQAEGDLSSLESRAGTMANLKVTGDSNKLAALKSIYDSLFGQEQSKASQASENAKLAEQAREANMSNSLDRQKLAQSSGSNGLTANEMMNQMSKYQLGYKPNNAGYAFKGPNGAVSMYDYISAVNNGDPNGTFSGMMSLLQKSPSQYDKAAFTAASAMQKSGQSQSAIMQKLAQQYNQLF